MLTLNLYFMNKKNYCNSQGSVLDKSTNYYFLVAFIVPLSTVKSGQQENVSWSVSTVFPHIL